MIASAPWIPPLELLDEELLDDELPELLPLEEDDPLLELLDDDVDEPLLEDEVELVLPELEVVLVSLLPPPQAVKQRDEIEASSSSGVGPIQSISDRTERDCSAYSLNGCQGEMSRSSD